MEIKNLKSVLNNSNIIEKNICTLLKADNTTTNFALNSIIETLGLNVDSSEVSKEMIPYFFYLNALKNHTFFKESTYSNYPIILDHIEKTLEILDNHKEHEVYELLDFKAWLGISDKFHNALISLL